MITVENLFSQYPILNQNSLPSALQLSEIAFIEENIDLYNEDETIKQYIDTFIAKLNNIITKKTETHWQSKPNQQSEPNRQSEPDRQIANETTKQCNQSKKSGKDRKQEAEKKEKQSIRIKQKLNRNVDDVVPDDVAFISPEVKFIKRFIGLHDTAIDNATILSFIKALQRSIVEKRIRKTSGYAKEIETIQDQLIECYNEMGKSIKITIIPNTLEKYNMIMKSEQVAATVKLIKQYISLQGKTDVKKKAKSLYNRIDKAINDGDISPDDIRYNEIHEIEQTLIAYLQDSTEFISIKETTLNGLRGIVGQTVNGLGNGEIEASTILSSAGLAGMEFDTIGLNGKYRELLGDPSVGFTAMVFGLPKSGKSTLCIDFAKYLAEHHGKVLYVAVEEGFGYTLKEKFERLHAIHPNLVIAETLPTDLSKWDFVFIDSVSKAGYTIEELNNLHKQFPKTSFIYIFHSTKDGKFRGSQQFAHDVDCIIDVINGEASANGRFGVGGKMNVFEE